MNILIELKIIYNFYPRSPCGERRDVMGKALAEKVISIHALLAESDNILCAVSVQIGGFLSTLSLRRATDQATSNQPEQQISIHALLAESDGGNVRQVDRDSNFYPRSPCGERRVHYDNYNLHCVISIHALLAESDGIGLVFMWWGVRFLSTLSLRRATGGNDHEY